VEGGQAMTCASCKGTRQIVLAYSVVDCLDCATVVSESTISPGTVNTSRYNLDGMWLPAAPMAKCTDGLRVGDRVRHHRLLDIVGSVTRIDTHNRVWVDDGMHESWDFPKNWTKEDTI
jgi:hypothetical protein